jgi:hypothetical protein
MEVKTLGVEAAHRRVFNDERTQAIVDAAHDRRHLVALVAAIIRSFTTAASLTDRKPNLRQVGETHKSSSGDRSAVKTICDSAEGLYADFNPGNVRGVLLEAMVQRAIQTRYGGAGDLLDNNLEVEVCGGGKSHRTSTSIDVIGVDDEADLGECHDCKVRSRDFDGEWLKELTGSVAPFGFRIGMATVDSERVAQHELGKIGIRPTGGATIVTPYRWADLPLHPQAGN